MKKEKWTDEILNRSKNIADSIEAGKQNIKIIFSNNKNYKIFFRMSNSLINTFENILRNKKNKEEKIDAITMVLIGIITVFEREGIITINKPKKKNDTSKITKVK